MRSELNPTFVMRPSVASRRGSTLVEFALVVPLFLLLVLAIFDFGGLLYAQITLQSAVSEAARFGITGRRLPDAEHPSGFLTREVSIREVVRRFAVGLDPRRIEITIEQRDGDRPAPIEQGGRLETLIIEARYPYRMRLVKAGGDAFTAALYAKAVMRNERFGSIRE
jgi:hypothetical protein